MAHGRYARKRLENNVNLIMPLGNAFSVPPQNASVLLVGGGVGVAPMLFWGAELKRHGHTP